jgi:two-component system phosphate regulon sensor histidine kinase PhoR
LFNPWISEAWRGGLILLAAVLIGILIGNIHIPIIMALAGYLFWHLRNLYRLEYWYRHRGRYHPPKASGVWGEVFYQVYQLQQRNRKRRKKLANILSKFNESTSAMPDATVVLTHDNYIEWFNKAANAYLDLSTKTDIGQRIDNLIRHPRFVDYLARGDFEKPLELTSPIDNERFFSVRIVPYGTKRLMVVRDITRIKLLERVRQDFVANVSHELRTPLTVVAGYLENMADSGDEIPLRWRKGLDQMQEQTLRMIRIVEDLLLLSRLEADENGPGQSPVAVPALLASIKDDAIALSGSRQHQLELMIDGDLWLKGTEKVLYSIFANLVFNAIHYTEAHGRITVRWYQCGEGACFEVEDTGIGIAPEHINRLTERFYRVDAGRSRASGGTGLGLAIVKHGLDRHGGRLVIQSEPGKGSRFRCEFPSTRVQKRAA